MRPSLRKIGLLCIVAGMTACVSCNSSGFLPFPKTVAWTQRTVDSAANVRPTAVVVADFDGDGLVDIVAGYPGTDTVTAAVFIFFQTDVDNFTGVLLAGHTDLTGLAALAVADLDADGRGDVVAACDGRLVYLHSPTDPREAAGWAISVIDQSVGDSPDEATDGGGRESPVGVITQWNDVAVGDIDGLNGPDIVACNADHGRLSWFQSPASPTSGAGWVRIDIDTKARANAASVALGNIAGGAGRIDIYSTAPGESTARVAWYQNPADPVNDAWTQTVIGNLPAATRMAIGDLNADGREDVVVTNPPGRQIGWYIRPTDPTTAWSGYLITQYTTDIPTDVQVADIDGDNQLDVVVAAEQAGSLRWFTPIGVQTLQWGENNLRDLNEAVGRIALGDIDNDGRPDVVAPLQAATTDQDSIAWFENPE